MCRKKQIGIIVLMMLSFVLVGASLHAMLHQFNLSTFVHCMLLSVFFSVAGSVLTWILLNRIAVVEAQNEALDFAARRDNLTRLYNRHMFDQDLRRLKSTAQLALIFIDIDNFRHYNNTWGHQVGDQVLEICARIVLKNIRMSDKAYRFGGDEIVILLNHCGKQEAGRIAQSIQRQIQAGENESHPLIGISAGVAAMPEDAATIRGLIEAGDVALIKAKSLGKNQVCVYSGD